MDRLEDFEAFIAVVEDGSLSAAARRLRRSLQAVSRSLSSLERSIGLELVHRTTRRCVPTEEGLEFYRRVQPAIAEIAEARLETANRRGEPAGTLIVGASVLFAPVFLVPAVAAFMEQYPNIHVELNLSDRFVDIVEERMDLAIRIGEMPSSTDLTVRQLGELRRVVFGAPSYFERYGRPSHPDELTDHQCMLRSAAGDTDYWPFRIDGKERSVRVSGRFRADHIAAVNAAAVEGLGIAFAPLWQIGGLVKQGGVELVLTEFEAPRVPVRAVWPTTKLPLSKKTRLFIDFLANQGLFADA